MTTTRNQSQKIGSRGHRWAMSEIEKHDAWIARGLDEDFGIDAEAELSVGQLTGQIIKLQFKASEHVEVKDGKAEVKLEQKYVHYARSCRYPLVLIRIDVTAETAWYIWIQDWIIQQQRTGDAIFEQGQWTVWVGEEKSLATGLNGELQDIARWRGQTQLALSIIDTIRASVATYDQRLIRAATDLLGAAEPALGPVALNVVVEEAIVLGNSMWGTAAGNALASEMYSLVRQHGRVVSASTLMSIVVRGKSYSRTGLSALWAQYDEYFEHTASLGLVGAFLRLDLIEVAYCCALREAHPESKSHDFMFRHHDFQFGGLRLVSSEEDRLADKFANRGASAICEMLQPICLPAIRGARAVRRRTAETG